MVTIVIILVFCVMITGITVIVKMPESKAPTRMPPAKLKETKVNNTKDDLFIKDMSLLDFAVKYGPIMQVGEHTKEGRAYHDCRFISKEGKETKVSFFSQLGELDSKEIENRKNELFIGQMKNGKYYLHDKNIKPWEDVDLNL